jgi:general secretion pathway protein L
MASVAGPGVANFLAGNWQHFLQWWLAELREALPAGWLGWLEGATAPRLLMWHDRDQVLCKLTLPASTAEARLPVVRFKEMLKAWLADQGFAREQILAGAVFGNELFLLRSLSVPKAALSALPRILDQEVLRRTPFQLSDIWHSASPHSVGSSDADVVVMRHWIVRKDRIEAELAKIGLEASDIDFLATTSEDGEASPAVTFHTTNSEDPPWARRAVKLLAIAALAFVMSSLAVFEWFQSSIASEIETSLVQMRRGGPNGIEPAVRLRTMKADASILEIWDELSRILPETTFLTDVRIVDSKVTISGFSSDAALLVRIIDKSQIFSKAKLTAAITPDATEHKDRFIISCQIGRGALLHQSAGSRISPS